jgi:uncharacterized protein (DUF1015 family)
MARFEPFRGTTYDPDRVVADDVIAPPYDVVSAASRQQLATRSPYNAIHVELPVPDPDAGRDAYENAASIFDRWHAEGTVRVGARPAYYVYRMTFREEDGSLRATTGVLGALGLDPDHRGDVLPHEQTTPKDKHDRLSLLRSARTNFSPIWGLAVGEGLSSACVAAIPDAGEPWSATDDSGVLHERFTVTDPDLIGRISAAVGGAPVLIADGHHRYETACTYWSENPNVPGSDLVLALVVELAEEQLAVQAIHRLWSNVDDRALPQLLTRHFEVTEGPADPIALRDTMGEVGALGLITRSGSWLLRPTEALEAAAPDDLDSSRLAFALQDLGIDPGAVTFQHGATIVRDAVLSGEANAAVLLRPVSIAQIARTARGGSRMPPKSTFFHPKPRTGVVFRELDPS